MGKADDDFNKRLQAVVEANKILNGGKGPAGVTVSANQSELSPAPRAPAGFQMLPPQPAPPQTGIGPGQSPFPGAAPVKDQPAPTFSVQPSEPLSSSAATPAPQAPTPPREPPPLAPGATSELPRFALPFGGGGGGGTVIPGGMGPDERNVTVKGAHAAPQEAQVAYGASTVAEFGAAKQRRDADMELATREYEVNSAKLAANDAAMADRQKIQVERAAEVERRLNIIDDFNAQAAKEIDPDKYWTDRGTAAHVIGAIAMGLGTFAMSATGGRNMAAEQIQAGINREMDAQIANQKSAQHRSTQEAGSLKLYLDAFGDWDKAVEAKRLGLYDNALTQMAQYKATHAKQVSEANYSAAVGALLAKRADVVTKLSAASEGEITREAKDKYHKAQVVGGGGGIGMSKADEARVHDYFRENKASPTIVIPAYGKNPEVRVSTSTPEAYLKLSKEQMAHEEIKRINDSAEREFDKLDKLGHSVAPLERREIATNLARLREEKVALGSVDLGQASLRDQEYFRGIASNVGWSGNLMASVGPVSLPFPSLEQSSQEERDRIRRFIHKQNNDSYSRFQGAVKSTGGSVVVQGIMRNPITKTDVKVNKETGISFTPNPIAPETARIPD